MPQNQHAWFLRRSSFKCLKSAFQLPPGVFWEAEIMRAAWLLTATLIQTSCSQPAFPPGVSEAMRHAQLPFLAGATIASFLLLAVA